MSIDISAKLLIGLSWTEIEPWLKENLRYSGQDLVDLIYDLEMECASPWYDSSRRDWFVGYNIRCDRSANEAWPAIYHCHTAFEKLTGMKGRLIVSADVT